MTKRRKKGGQRRAKERAPAPVVEAGKQEAAEEEARKEEVDEALEKKEPEDVPREPRAREESTTALTLRISAAIGVGAAIVVAVLVNIIGARHYRRWDATDDDLYTISRVTEQTLKTLPEDIDIYVLLSSSDPLTLTLRHLLEAYASLTNHLRVRYIDPDRNPAEFIAVQQKFGINAGKTEEGRVVTDASLVVAAGARKHFISADELVEVQPGEEARSRSKVEEQLTGAIKVVTTGATPRICFSTGHGEASMEEAGVEGLQALEARLEKINYTTGDLKPARGGASEDDIDKCRLVVVAGPTERVDDADVERLKHYVEGGGNLMAFVGPELGGSGQGFVDQGLAPLLAMGGIRKRNDLVFETDPARIWSVGQGEAFMVEPKPHDITNAFVELGGALSIVLTVASSLEAIDTAAVKPTPLLETSDAAFGMRDFVAWSENPVAPERQPHDQAGPLVIAYAAELPKQKADAPHGPRMVVFGTKSAIVGANWRNERLLGTARLVENAIAWLAHEEVILDIPEKPARSVGGNITQDTMVSAAYKLIILLPLSTALLGLVVAIRRRLGGKEREPTRDPDRDPDEGAP